MPELDTLEMAPQIWQVGALCRAIAGVLDARLNPVAVRGELSGFTRASSGHCYFTLKDESGQIRCAMFRRSATLLEFSPSDGERVEVRGQLGVYEARGDLQLVVQISDWGNWQDGDRLECLSLDAHDALVEASAQ